MKIYELIQEEIKDLCIPINSKSEYNLSMNRGDRMKEQIITHYLSEIEDPGINSILMTRDDVLFLTKTGSKTYLNDFLSSNSSIITEKDEYFFEKLSATLRDMEVWKIAFDINTIEEQNRIFKLLRDQYWVPKDLINLGTDKKPFFITVFTPFEMSYKG